MDRVEFYLDGAMFDFSTVAPYTKRWTIVMSDTVPVGLTLPDPNLILPESVVEGERVTASRLITTENTIDYTQTITVANQVTATRLFSESGRLEVMQSFPGGRSIISDTFGYTETHTVHVLAFDAAGNEMKSEELTIYIVHEVEEEKEEGSTGPPTAMLGLNDRWAWLPPTPGRRWPTG